MQLTLPTRRAKSRINTRTNGYNPKYGFNRGLIAQTGFIPEGAQLLQDTWPLKIIDTKSAITEAVAGGAPVTRVRGVFQLADEQNANGRIYPGGILHEAVQAIQEDLNARSVWGEFDHPPDAKIHLDRISHLITKIWMEGKKVFGEAEIMEDMPYGKQLSTLLKHGTIGISSRGIGDMEVRDNGGSELYYVTEGYRFVTWDAVAEPSVSGAILHIAEGRLRPLRNRVPVRQNLLDNKHYEGMLVEEFGEYLNNR
jgi:hypothetical protein